MRTGTVTATSLNLRDQPSLAGVILAQLAQGDQVRVLAQSGVWYQVKAGARTGFVHGDFLRITEAPSLRGFLKDRPGLLARPLAAPAGRQLTPKPATPLAQRNAARIWNTFGGLLGALSDLLELEPAVAVAIVQVESGGTGFGADGRLLIRFENHIFFREWGKLNVSPFTAAFKFDPAKPWLGHQFREKATRPFEPVHTGSQDSEWRAFAQARKLAPVPALRSISMGLPQTMGFNHALVGYDSVQAMFDAYSAGLAAQVLGLFDYLKGREATSEALQAAQRRQFLRLAELYNGSGQAAEYGARLEAAAFSVMTAA
jgi:hypothetical protein